LPHTHMGRHKHSLLARRADGVLLKERPGEMCLNEALSLRS
jgi:hypothetical protein